MKQMKCETDGLCTFSPMAKTIAWLSGEALGAIVTLGDKIDVEK